VARSIVATGTVNPVVTVQVGTYVSGPIQSISCDYNTQVKAGQLCAKIDPRPYQEALDEAKANLATARAQLHKDQASLVYAKINYERDSGLRKTGVVSQDTLDNDKSTYDQAVAQVALDEATIEQRQAALDAAQVNLDYTNIVSPVNGTVVSRNVDVGQTVAASFQTPTLFLIAKDLTKMQVDTNVSESDVGAAQVGQKARFTVEAFPHKTFEGQVVQVRRAPITVQNVVTYDVVIGVDNPELLLFPGMTANARIIVAERTGVPIVPMQALRFDPRGLRAGDEAGASAKHDGQRVWVLRDGRPAPVKVSVGIDDGTRVEIVGDSPPVGEPVIVEQSSGGGAQREGAPPTRSPFRL
jgi:HlyD family secretion protein